jgi:hypothetical protein
LELPAPAPLGLWLFGRQYFVLQVRLPAHCRAFLHFFSEISRLRLARDLGRGVSLLLDLPGGPSPSTSVVLRSAAAALAHSSAFSLPAIPLCAGHYENLDGDAWLSVAQRGDVFPCPEGILLPWAGGFFFVCSWLMFSCWLSLQRKKEDLLNGYGRPCLLALSDTLRDSVQEDLRGRECEGERDRVLHVAARVQAGTIIIAMLRVVRVK